MPVHIADDPLTCVVRGTGHVLQDVEVMSRLLVTRPTSGRRADPRLTPPPPAVADRSGAACPI